ncbi:MAG: TolC family protein [Bacteroidales bacterium]|nr:TolC family protein [Bacteroidales bacterium]
MGKKQFIYHKTMKRSLKTMSMGTILSAFGLFCPLVAQTSDSISMNLDKVLEVALSDNPDIQVANRTIEIKKYAKKETITGLFPTVDFTLAGIKGVIIPEANLGGMKIKMGSEKSFTWTGTATLPLVVPQLWESLKISQSSVELALEEARSSKISTLATVKKAFYQLLYARDSYDVLLQSYALADENLTQARNKFGYDIVPEYDTLTAYVQKVSLEPTMLSMKNTLALAEMQLKVLMGVDVNEPIRFEGHLSDYEEKLFNDLLILKEDNGIDNNSSLIQIDIQKRQLILSERLNKLGYIPTVALQFSINRAYSGFLGYANTANLTLALNWTIFDGGSKYMKTRQNKLSIENLEQTQEYIKQQLEMSVSASLNSIETAAEQVVSNKSSVYASERTYEISSKRYEVGMGTQLELNSSATSLQQTRLQYVQSIFDFVTAQAALEETLGKVITDK